MRDMILKLYALEDVLKNQMRRDNVNDFFYSSIKQEYIALCDEIKSYIEVDMAKKAIEDNPFFSNKPSLLSILKLYDNYENDRYEDDIVTQLHVLLYLYMKDKGE